MIEFVSPAEQSHFKVIKNLLLVGLSVLTNSSFTGECDLPVLINYGYGHAALEEVWVTHAGAVGEQCFLLVISHNSPYQCFTRKSHSSSGVTRL